MYKWNNPHEWMHWYVDQLRNRAFNRDAWALTQLAGIAKFLAAGLSADEIQDDFQAEMETSGYFMEDRNAIP